MRLHHSGTRLHRPRSSVVGRPSRQLHAPAAGSSAGSQACAAISKSGSINLPPTPPSTTLDAASDSSRRGLLLAATSLALLLPAANAPRAAAGQPRQLSANEQAIVDNAVTRIIVKGKAPVALRLAYHDAATFAKATGDGGMNASIRFELDRPENKGLKRGWRLIEEIEKLIKGTPAEGKVSYADLVALSGAQAVAVCGGPEIPVPVGRVDATGPDPERRIPMLDASVAELKANFGAKGFSVQEMVILSGAHTIGSKGFGQPDVFDNAYFVELLNKPWLDPNNPMHDHIGLPSDHVLPEDAECLHYIKGYATDQAAFFRDFTAAYIKMSALGAKFA